MVQHPNLGVFLLRHVYDCFPYAKMIKCEHVFQLGSKLVENVIFQNRGTGLLKNHPSFRWVKYGQFTLGSLLEQVFLTKYGDFG